MTAAASQNQPPATSPTAADTFAWVDAAQSFAEHRARLEHDAAQWLSNDPAISVGSVKLMAELRRLGWVDAKNVPYQSQITAGRMRRKSSTYIDPFGEEQVSITARLTVKGVRDLHRRLGGSQLPALALVSGGSL